MPSDLTGTPTSLGIGTYNTSNDAPSGLGFNEAMAQIDALIADRIPAPASPVVHGAVVWDGSSWVAATGGDGSGSHFLADDGTYKAVSGTTYRKTTAKAVNTTVAATDLLNGEITVAAGALGTNKLLRLTAIGDYLNNSGATQVVPRFQLAFGGTTQLDTGTSPGGLGLGASASRGSWKIVVELVNTATNVQAIHFHLVMFGPTFSSANWDFTTGEGGYQISSKQGLAAGYAAGAIDTTVAQPLVLNVINGVSNALYEVKLAGALVEVI